MKKWSLLVATLMLMGATATTFTSCVDTDEPDGILEMRKAKAEYIRALAAVENAKIAHVQAQAQSEAATAELLKAQTQVALAQAEVEKAKAQAEIIKAEAEAKAEALLAEGKNEIAKAEAAKILAEAAQAEAECQQTIAQNEIALKEMQANLEVKLQMAQTELVKAQMAYQQALKDLAVLDLIASPYEAKLIAQARTNYENAYYSVEYWAKEVNTQQAALIRAMYGQEDALEALNHNLADKKADLAAKQAAYEELKKLAANVSVSAWETRRDSLLAYVGHDNIDGTYKLDSAQLELQKAEIKQSPEYAAAEKQENNDKKAFIQAEQYYNYLTNAQGNDQKKECFGANDKVYGHTGDATVHAGGSFTTSDTDVKKYTFDKIVVKVENKKLQEKINASYPEGKKLTFNEKGEVELVAKSQNETYDKIKTAFAANKADDKFDFSTALRTFEDAVKAVNVVAEELEGDTCKKNFEKAVADAQDAHTKAVAKWEAAHKTYQTGVVPTPTSTDAAKAAIALYNDNIDKLIAAVNNYNSAFDAAKAQLVEEKLEEDKISKAKTTPATSAQLETWLGYVGLHVSDIPASYTKISQIEGLIQTKSTASDGETIASVQAGVRKVISDLFENQSEIQKAAQRETAENTLVSDLGGLDKFQAKVVANIPAAVTKDLNDAQTALSNAVGYDETKKEYTGSYATIQKALDDLAAEANKNSQMLKMGEKETKKIAAGKIASATGANVERNKAGESEGATAGTPVNATTDWALDELKLNTSKIYAKTGHKEVVRTKFDETNFIELITDEDAAKSNWIQYSAEAFGTIKDEKSARHTELTADMIKNMKEDELSRTLANLSNSTLGDLIDKKNTLAEHNALQVVNADVEAVKTLVTAAKEALQAAIADVKKPIEDQEKVVADAKKAHQDSYKAKEKLTKPVQDKIDAIAAKVKQMGDIKNALVAILNAYYGNQEIKYATFEGDPDDADKDGYASVNWTDPQNKDFKQIEKWLNTQIKKYTTNSTANAQVGPGKDDHGYIANAQAEVDKLQKELDRYTENGLDKEAQDTKLNEFNIANKKLDLEKAEAMLKLYQEKFTRAEEALAKVLEAVGNGVANGNQAIVEPSAKPGATPTGQGGAYVPGQTNTDITVDLYGQANKGITIDL